MAIAASASALYRVTTASPVSANPFNDSQLNSASLPNWTGQRACIDSCAHSPTPEIESVSQPHFR